MCFVDISRRRLSIGSMCVRSELLEADRSRQCAVLEKYMAQSLHIGLYCPFTNLPFDICAIYFDLKVILFVLQKFGHPGCD